MKENLVVMPTDKTMGLSVETKESYKAAAEIHIMESVEAQYSVEAPCERSSVKPHVWPEWLPSSSHLVHTFQIRTLQEMD